MKFIYIIELSDVQDSGLNGNIYKRYYCKSVKDANHLITNMIECNKGFDVNELQLDNFDEAEGYIRKLYYKWDIHKQGESNLHLPQRDVITSVYVKKVKLEYT